MTFHLTGGGTLTVLDSGAIECRMNGRTLRNKGRGSYRASVDWVRGRAFGRELRYVSGK